MNHTIKIYCCYLFQAAARKLAPRRQDKLSPREHLLECIKSGNVKLRSTSLTSEFI